MEDPIQRHPTRIEQLDILAEAMADAVRALPEGPGRILDLGCGTGYFPYRLSQKVTGMAYTAVDLSQDSLSAAQENLAGSGLEFRGVVGNLMEVGGIDVGAEPFDLVCTCLTFHDLTDDGKQAVFRWVAERLADGGYFFVYDRIRLTSEALFPLQRSLWRRIESVYGRGMRTAASFADYQADLGQGNDPAALADYLEWYEAAGFEAACLHQHGNVVLLAGRK